MKQNDTDRPQPMEQPSKLDLSGYRTELERITLSFEIVRFCMRKNILNDRRVDEFFAEQRQSIKSFLASPPRPAFALPPDTQKLVLLAHQRKFKPAERRQYLDHIDDWLNRSELLLLAAAFEYCLGQILQRLIWAEPRRVFANSEKTVKLKEILADRNLDLRHNREFRVILAEKCAEIIDRGGFVKRLGEIKERYNLNPPGKDDARMLEELAELRNDVAHRLLDDRTKTVVSVSPAQLKSARMRFRATPDHFVREAAKSYPDFFA